MKTSHIRFHGAKNSQLDTYELEPLKDNQICCRGLKSVISAGTESIQYIWEFDNYHRYPVIKGPIRTPGYSMAAEVVAVGKDVKGYRPGDKVYACYQHMQYFNIEPTPAFIDRIPDDIAPQYACWLTILRCALYAVMKANIHAGSNVLILGQGIFGAACTQFARIYGAKNIIVADPIKTRAERAIKLGATHALAKPGDSIRADVLDILGGELPECVIDATASSESFSQACVLTRNNGDVSLIADSPTPSRQHVGWNILTGYLNIHGIYIRMQTQTPNAFAPKTIYEVHNEIFEYIRNGDIDIDSMITGYVNPVDTGEIMSRISKNRDNELGLLYDWTLLADPNI